MSRVSATKWKNKTRGGRKVTLKQTYTPIESSSIEEVFGIRYWVLGSYPFSFVQIAEETNVYIIYADFNKHTNTQYPVPITQYPVPSTQYPIPNTRYPVPSTQYPLPNTQYPIPDTPCHEPSLNTVFIYVYLI